MYAVPEGNTEQSVCRTGADNQASTWRRPAWSGESGNDDENQGMSQMRPLHDEMSVLSSYSDNPGEEPKRLRRHPRRTNKGPDNRRQNLKSTIK